MRIATLVLGTLLVLAWGGPGWAEEAEEPALAPAETASPTGTEALPASGAVDAERAGTAVAPPPESAALAPDAPGVESDAPGPVPAAPTDLDQAAAPAADDTTVAPESSGPAPEVALDEAQPEPEEASADAAGPSATLGPVGYDAEGRPGRIHIVNHGDTLWDISDAYLGTPWVWPSIWDDNPDVANPHLIYPGDRIWITPTEMRRVTEEEAEQLLAGAPAPPAPEPLPAAIEDVPIQEAAARTFRLSSIESVGFVSGEALEAAASIVDSAKPILWFSQGSTVYVGLGEGEVQPGDQFTVVRAIRPVKDLDTGEQLGVYIEKLGWLEITEVHPESSLGFVRASVAEMRRGDRILPREVPAEEIALRQTPPGLEGRIVYTPESRTTMATRDVVFLDRGTDDGLHVGHQLEVYHPGRLAMDTARGDRVRLPDDVLADLLVISAQPETAVAIVTRAKTQLSRGDPFRTGSGNGAE